MWLFSLLALLLLIPWPVAYAHTLNGVMVVQDGVQIAVIEDSAPPTWTTFGKAIGSVILGDLFYIDTTDNPADIMATLHITNAQELIGYYRNLILKVGIYTKSAGGEWEKVSMSNGETVSNIFITMHNGRVSFTLPGLTKYKIAIDSGSFYCTTANTDKGSLSPQFYLEVN